MWTLAYDHFSTCRKWIIQQRCCIEFHLSSSWTTEHIQWWRSCPSSTFFLQWINNIYFRDCYRDFNFMPFFPSSIYISFPKKENFTIKGILVFFFIMKELKEQTYHIPFRWGSFPCYSICILNSRHPITTSHKYNFIILWDSWTWATLKNENRLER